MCDFPPAGVGWESSEEAVCLLQWSISTCLVLARAELFSLPLEAWDVIKLRSNGPLQLFPASRMKQHMDGASLFFVLLAGEEPLEPRFLGAVCPPRPALCWLLSGAAQSRP